MSQHKESPHKSAVTQLMMIIMSERQEGTNCKHRNNASEHAAA